MTMAKGIANGLPLGASIATPEIAASLKALTISTFGGNPVSCAAANATIEIIEDEDLPGNAERMGARAACRPRGAAAPLSRSTIGDVRGMGLMQAIELVDGRDGGRPHAGSAPDDRVFEETPTARAPHRQGRPRTATASASRPPLNVTRVRRRRGARASARVVRGRRSPLSRKNPKRRRAHMWWREQNHDVFRAFDFSLRGAAPDRPHRRFAQPPLGRRPVLRLRLLQRDPGCPAQAEPVSASRLRGAAGVPADREHAAGRGAACIADSRPSRSPSGAASPTTTRRVEAESSTPGTSSG